MEADATWDDINNGCDVIGMLQLIRNCEVQCQTCRDEDITLIEAMKATLNCKQGAASNSEYYETFKDQVATANRLGAAIGEQQQCIRERLAEFALNKDDPTAAELTQATTNVQEKFLACLFLLNSDKKRYSNLVHDINNDYTRGMTQIPIPS